MSTKRILVAEDDSFLSNAYRAKFRKSGYEVTILSDGSEVLEALKIQKPDIILLDLIMPKMDGFTVLEKIKADPGLRDIPVLIASNLGQKEDIDRGMALGADEYIVKSDLSLDELIEKTESLIN